MIEITPTIAIREDELSVEFVRSAGPGGQHVNKSSTAVQLRFDVANSPSLPHGVKQRLTNLAGSRITDSGILIITSRERRSQLQNREAAVARLVAMIRKAAEPPRKRKKTKPTRASKEKRLDKKKKRSNAKQMRSKVNPRDY